MATNYIYEGEQITMAVPSGTDSGDPLVINGFPVVAIEDRNAAGNATVVTRGVFDLSVKAIDDSGNNAVAVGDIIYYVSTDTPVLSKKSLAGLPFGYALEVVTLGATATIQVMVMQGLAKVPDDTGRGLDVTFNTSPVTSKVGGGAATGTAADLNLMILNGGDILHYSPLGTQTILAPKLGAAGLDIGMDQTANDGVQINPENSTIGKSVYTVGTDACYIKCKLSIEDVSGTDDCAIGFRKVEALAAGLTYTDFAVLNVISGTINIETNLNNAGIVTTSTTNTWADLATKTLEVYVTSAGVVTYKIDGAAPTVTAAFTFDSTDKIIPFIFFLNDTDLAGAVQLQTLEYDVM